MTWPGAGKPISKHFYLSEYDWAAGWDPISKYIFLNEYESRTCRKPGRLARLAVNSPNYRILSWIWSIYCFMDFCCYTSYKNPRKSRNLRKSTKKREHYWIQTLNQWQGPNQKDFPDQRLFFDSSSMCKTNRVLLRFPMPWWANWYP